jgi:hypothetical protein
MLQCMVLFVMWRIRHIEETRSVFEIVSEQLHVFC